MDEISKLSELVSKDAGDPAFADLARHLLGVGESDRAMQICLEGLSNNPSCYKGRLVLARVFYELGYLPFAVRELEQLNRELPHRKTISRLLQKLSANSVTTSEGGSAAPKIKSETVAQADFDIDDLEATDD